MQRNYWKERLKRRHRILLDLLDYMYCSCHRIRDRVIHLYKIMTKVYEFTEIFLKLIINDRKDSPSTANKFLTNKKLALDSVAT